VRFLVPVHVKGGIESCVVCCVVMTKVRQGNWLLLRSEAEYIVNGIMSIIVVNVF